MTRFFLFLFLLLPVSAFSQTFTTSLDVPALTSGRVPPLTGGQPVVRFDRRILVQVISGPAGEFCLYMNTRTGDIGIRYGRSGELGGCELNIDDEKFRLMLVRATGQVQTYMNAKQNGVLRHLVMTGNTEVYPVSFRPMENAELNRLAGSDSSRRSGRDGRAYSANSTGAPTFYLQGRTEPVRVTTQDFLGYSGIGYLKTNHGVFMVVRADMGPAQYRAYSWSDVTTDFDMHPFESVESMINEKVTTGLDRQEEKLRNETPSGDCASEESELKRLKLADVEARRRSNSQRNSGNIYENESTRRAYGEMMLPNLEVMNQELEVKVCKANVRLNRTRGEAQRADISRRIQCYRQSQRELSQIQADWNAIDARYPNEAGRAYSEKTRTFGRIMSLGSDCR